MKTIKLITFLSFIGIANLVSGQDTIDVSHNKTTPIELPARIIPVAFSDGPASRFYRLSGGWETEIVDVRQKTSEEEVSSKLASGRVRNVATSDRKGKVKAELGQISVSGNTLFYKLKVENNSSINYDLDFTRFYVRDLTIAKRTIMQEREISPTHTFGTLQNTVTAGGSNIYVFAINKFPLSKDQALFIEIYEKNGARHLYLKVKAKENVKAQLVKQ